MVSIDDVLWRWNGVDACDYVGSSCRQVDAQVLSVQPAHGLGVDVPIVEVEKGYRRCTSVWCCLDLKLVLS